MTYSYNPLFLKKQGKDQLRFELGDTAVEEGADVCVFCDEEYQALLDDRTSFTQKEWLTVKLEAVNAALYKFSHQVNTKIDTLSYNLSDRATQWESLRDTLKSELDSLNAGVCLSASKVGASSHFYSGLHRNPCNHSTIPRKPKGAPPCF